MRFANNNLELWYATPDAPAPEGTTERREDISVTVGVRPSSPDNVVVVRYRVDGGGVQVLKAPLVASDFPTRTQYFRATFPRFWSGDLVEYVPIVTCAGRRAPDPATAGAFPSSFRLEAAPAAQRDVSQPIRSAAAALAYPATLEHLVNVRVQLARQGEVVGDTPAGYVVNWPPASGRLDGPAFHATVMPGGEHETIIRPDGVGILSVRVSVQTDDQALISLRYSGVVDYGPDGLARLRAGQWPAALPVRTAIRLLTEHRKYQWLNRLQCVGIGQVLPAQLLYAYDLYALR